MVPPIRPLLTTFNRAFSRSLNPLSPRNLLPTARLFSTSNSLLSQDLPSTTETTHRDAYLERLSGKDNGITLLNLNRPKARNALSVNLVKEFMEAVEEVRFDGTTRTLILRSTTPITFCSGADLKERRTMSPSQVSKFLLNLRRMLSGLEDLPMPTIAAIDGFALGGGLELALACDLRVAKKGEGESDGGAKVALPETKLGIIPGAGGTQRATRLLGISKTKDLIFTGRTLSPDEALEIGLVDYVTSPDQTATDKALQVARLILPNAPIAVQMAKIAVDSGSQLDLENALDFERQCYNSCINTKDRLEGLKAFAEKRKPVYIGE